MELRQVNVLCAERWGDIDGLRCGIGWEVFGVCIGAIGVR